MLRVLEHNFDADARIVAILMHKMGIDEMLITHEDEAKFSTAMGTKCVVFGGRGDGCAVLKVVEYADVPKTDEVIQ